VKGKEEKWTELSIHIRKEGRKEEGRREGGRTNLISLPGEQTKTEGRTHRTAARATRGLDGGA